MDTEVPTQLQGPASDQERLILFFYCVLEGQPLLRKNLDGVCAVLFGWSAEHTREVFEGIVASGLLTTDVVEAEYSNPVVSEEEDDDKSSAH